MTPEERAEFEKQARIYRVAGLAEDGGTLTMHPAKWRCGHIKDGVSIHLSNSRGGFVIAYEDLLDMAAQAQLWRDKQDPA